MELLELPFEPASASVARRHIVHVLRTRGIEAATCHEAAVVVSELVGNAVRHGAAMRGGRLHVAWHYGDSGLRIEVSDGGGGRPVSRRTDALEAGGRGLGIVAALSGAWGYTVDDAGTTVWAQVGIRPVTDAPQELDPAEYEAAG